MISIDSTIVAALVSAIIAFVILGVSSLVDQPRKLKNRLKIDFLEKQLGAYGALVALINSLQAKSQRTEFLRKQVEYKFTMENPYDYKRLLNLIEKQNYLFSKNIAESWTKFLEKDIHFSLMSNKGNTLGVDLKEMQELAVKEYDELKVQYEKLTNIKLLS